MIFGLSLPFSPSLVSSWELCWTEFSLFSRSLYWSWLSKRHVFHRRDDFETCIIGSIEKIAFISFSAHFRLFCFHFCVFFFSSRIWTCAEKCQWKTSKVDRMSVLHANSLFFSKSLKISAVPFRALSIFQIFRLGMERKRKKTTLNCYYQNKSFFLPCIRITISEDMYLVHYS